MGLRGIPMGPSFRVSIVDDSADFCALVATALASAPHFQLIGSHEAGESAMAAFKIQPPDILSL
jgi:chemotaxis response regulator CheB